MGGMSILAKLKILDHKRSCINDINSEIIKFLDENFSYKKGMVLVKSKNKELEFNFVAGGLVYALREQFPVIKHNELILVREIIKDWCKKK